MATSEPRTAILLGQVRDCKYRAAVMWIPCLLAQQCVVIEGSEVTDSTAAMICFQSSSHTIQFLLNILLNMMFGLCTSSNLERETQAGFTNPSSFLKEITNGSHFFQMFFAVNAWHSIVLHATWT